MNASEDISHRRLEHLYEISKLFASFESVEATVGAALAMIARTLPLRSAVLLDAGMDGSCAFVWASEGLSAAHRQAAVGRVAASFQYLVGAESVASLELEEKTMPPLPAQTESKGDLSKRFLALPLVVAHSPVFGALQLEAARPLDKMDLMYASAVANQLGVALDRDHAWRRDIASRESAEEGRVQAERDQDVAERAAEEYQALAAENARLYAEAQRAVQLREQILAVVSHDLRNPLSTILTATRALSSAHAPQENAQRIERSVERMRRLIEDLLDFANIEAGKLAIDRGPEDPGSIVQEAIASIGSGAGESSIELRADVAAQLPNADCDRDRVLQVLSNLLANATKLTPPGGRITVRVEARGSQLLFAVSDTGPGIRAEDLSHLFERYWRSELSTYQGSGLGLGIARGIVEAHGGRIWVHSEPGRGATFFFTIPTVADAAETPHVTVP